MIQPTYPSSVFLARRLFARIAFRWPTKPPRKPHLILILADDLGYGDDRVSSRFQPEVLTLRSRSAALEGLSMTPDASGIARCVRPTRAAFV